MNLTNVDVHIKIKYIKKLLCVNILSNIFNSIKCLDSVLFSVSIICEVLQSLYIIRIMNYNFYNKNLTVVFQLECICLQAYCFLIINFISVKLFTE